MKLVFLNYIHLLNLQFSQAPVAAPRVVLALQPDALPPAALGAADDCALCAWNLVDSHAAPHALLRQMNLNHLSGVFLWSHGALRNAFIPTGKPFLGQGAERGVVHAAKLELDKPEAVQQHLAHL